MMQVTATAVNAIDHKPILYRGAPADLPQTMQLTIALVDGLVTLTEASELGVIFYNTAPTRVTAAARGPWSAPTGRLGTWTLKPAAAGAPWTNDAKVVLTVEGLDPDSIGAATLKVDVYAIQSDVGDQKTSVLSVSIDDYARRGLADLNIDFRVVGRRVELGSGRPVTLTVAIGNPDLGKAAASSGGGDGSRPTVCLEALVGDGVSGVLARADDLKDRGANVRSPPGCDWSGSGEKPVVADGRATWTFHPGPRFLPAGGTVVLELELSLDGPLPPSLPDVTPLILSWSNIPGCRNGVASLLLERRAAEPFVRLRNIEPERIEAGGTARLNWESYAVAGLNLQEDGREIHNAWGSEAAFKEGFKVSPAWNGELSQQVRYTLRALDKDGRELQYPTGIPDRAVRLKDSAILTITAKPPKIRSFTARPWLVPDNADAEIAISAQIEDYQKDLIKLLPVRAIEHDFKGAPSKLAVRDSDQYDPRLEEILSPRHYGLKQPLFKPGTTGEPPVARAYLLLAAASVHRLSELEEELPCRSGNDFQAQVLETHTYLSLLSGRRTTGMSYQKHFLIFSLEFPWKAGKMQVILSTNFMGVGINIHSFEPDTCRFADGVLYATWDYKRLLAAGAAIGGLHNDATGQLNVRISIKDGEYPFADLEALITGLYETTEQSLKVGYWP